MKTAFVTGGSRGIGRAIVEKLSKEGYTVAFTYLHSEKEAKEVARLCGALAIRADSEREEEIVGAVDTALDALTHIDVLVNNAGVSSFCLFDEITTPEWERILRINLTAPFLYSRAVLPSMIRRKQGRIINISSMWGLVGAAMEVHYSTAKAGLIGMTKALAKEVGPSGITVNAVAPGTVDTEMNAHLSEEDRAALAADTPLGRIGTPGQIADVVAFLSSDASSYITGEVLNVSGGYVI